MKLNIIILTLTLRQKRQTILKTRVKLCHPNNKLSSIKTTTQWGCEHIRNKRSLYTKLNCLENKTKHKLSPRWRISSESYLATQRGRRSEKPHTLITVDIGQALKMLKRGNQCLTCFRGRHDTRNGRRSTIKDIRIFLS